MDMKYDKMVAITQEESRHKIQLAQDTITAMMAGREKITVAELVKRTGLSRGFFYKNEIIRAEIDKAVDEQKNMHFEALLQEPSSKKVEPELLQIKKRNEELEVQNGELRSLNEKLQNEIDRLNQRLARKELSVLKKL